MSGNTKTPGTTVASRVLAILGAFDEGHRRLSLSDVARRSGLSIPTAHRLLFDLQGWGAVSRVESGEYVVGRRLWMVGMLAPVQRDFRDLAAPFVQDLHAATNATVHLAVRDGAEGLFVDRLGGRRSVPVTSRVGILLPLHATGVGKVLLAAAPAEVQAQVFSSLTRYTPHTIVQPSRLGEELVRAQREGWAETREEKTLGHCSLAVPITDGDSVVAALGVVVSDVHSHRERLISALRVAAHGISRVLATSEPTVVASAATVGGDRRPVFHSL